MEVLGRRREGHRTTSLHGRVGCPARAALLVRLEVHGRRERTTETSATAHAQTQVGPRPRLVGLDAARALAIIGMVVVNVGPTNAETVLERLYLLPFGRASVLFVTIAGLGMGFFLRRRSGCALWSPLAWRVLLLLVVGLALQSTTQTVSVILPTYAVLFLLAPPLWRLPTRWLVALTLVVTVAGPAVLVRYDITHLGIEDQGPSLGTPPDEALRSLLITGPYPLLSWTVPFVVGLILSRVDLTSTALVRRLAVWGGVAAVGAFVVATTATALLGPRADRGWPRLLTGVAHGQMPLWLVSATGGAVLVIAACLLLGRRLGRLMSGLAVMGTYALTLYVLHVLVLAVVKPDEGLGSFIAGAGVSAGLLALLVLVVVLWERTGLPGPLEWVLRHPWLRPPPPVEHPTAQETPR